MNLHERMYGTEGGFSLRCNFEQSWEEVVTESMNPIKPENMIASIGNLLSTSDSPKVEFSISAEKTEYFAPETIIDLKIWVEPDELETIINFSGTSDNSESSERSRERMKNVYQVIVIIKETDAILINTTAIGIDEEEAKFNVGVYAQLKEDNLKLDEVAIIMNKLGHYREKGEV